MGLRWLVEARPTRASTPSRSWEWVAGGRTGAYGRSTREAEAGASAVLRIALITGGSAEGAAGGTGCGLERGLGFVWVGVITTVFNDIVSFLGAICSS